MSFSPGYGPVLQGRKQTNQQKVGEVQKGSFYLEEPEPASCVMLEGGSEAEEPLHELHEHEWTCTCAGRGGEGRGGGI